MSDYGQMIDPYRGPGTQGDIIGALQDILLRQQQVGQLRRAEDERGATNMAINQQNGWQGVDPQQMQQFNQGQQTMGIQKATEGRTAQTYQQNQDFTNAYTRQNQGMLADSQDPGLRSVANMPPNPAATSWIMDQLAAMGGDTRRVQGQQQLQQDANKFTTGRDQTQNQFAIQMAMQQAMDAWNRTGMEVGSADDRQLRELAWRSGEAAKTRTAEQNQLEFGPNAVRDFAAGKVSKVEVLSKLHPQTAMILEPALDAIEANKGKQKDATGFRAAIGGDGAAVSTDATAQSRGEAKKQAQRLKDDAYNRKNKLWDYLPDNESRQLQQQPKLVDAIRQSIIANATGQQSDLPPPDYYKKLVPHILRMVTENTPELTKTGFYKGK